MEITLLRIFLTPILVLTIYLLQKKWGARAGGLFLGLPINITPFLIIIHLQESNEFLKDAIHGVFVGQIVLLIFAYAYSRLATLLNWWLTITLVTLITLSSSLMLHYLNLSFSITLSVTFILYLVVRKTWPKTSAISNWQEPTNWDLPFRLVVTSLTVFILTTFSNLLGPIVSGTFSAYPIILTFLGSLSHRRSGPSHILKTLQGMTYSLPLSYAIFIFILVII
jgi:hypothetical protein